MIIEVVKGDITEISADAIVNPANSLLIMGGGVAGVIKRKGGEIIEREALKHAPCPVGKAVITAGGTLKAKYVIHAPTMEKPAMPTTLNKVVKAIKAALEIANQHKLKTIAFPGMGTGVGGLTAKEGAEAFEIALREYFSARKQLSLQKIILVAYTDDLYNEFLSVKKFFDNPNLKT